MEVKRNNWFVWPLQHYSISLLIIVILFALGIFGLFDMPKDEFPQFTIRQGVVVGVYPGATSEEVEEQLTRPLERYLFTFGEVKRSKTTSTSKNGMSLVMVRLNDDVNNKSELLKINMDNAWNNLQETWFQIDIAKKSIEQADENLRLNRICYKAGTATLSDLMQAQSLQQKALDQYYDAYIDYQMKLLQYRQAIGL